MAYTGMTYNFYNELIETTSDNRNVLIAGMAGAGKSVIINGMINSILYKNTSDHIMALVDPKRVELAAYENMPHCGIFATESYEIEDLLRKCLKIIDKRTKEMREQRKKFYDGPRLHIFIDEMADLMLTSKKAADYIQRIAQIGRAANVQLICATQCPLASVIPTRIQVNFGVIIGLHTRNAQDSRNILGVAGCERLPKYGKALIQYLEEVEPQEVMIPMVPEEEINKIIDYRLEQMKEAS